MIVKVLRGELVGLVLPCTEVVNHWGKGSGTKAGIYYVLRDPSNNGKKVEVAQRDTEVVG